MPDTDRELSDAVKRIADGCKSVIEGVIGAVGSDERELFTAKLKKAVTERLRGIFGPDEEEPPAV